MAHDYCICGADRVSCIDCAEAEIDSLTTQLAEAKQELTEKDKQLFEENLQVKRLEQKLADEQKAAGYWMEQSCKDHNRAEKAEKELSHYQGGFEVDGFSVGGVSISLDKPIPWGYGQRVRVLVMPLESEV